MERQHTAAYYWDKYREAEKAWHRGLEMIHEHSDPILVANLLAIHKLMEILEASAHKATEHAPMHAPPTSQRMQ